MKIGSALTLAMAAAASLALAAPVGAQSRGGSRGGGQGGTNMNRGGGQMGGNMNAGGGQNSGNMNRGNWHHRWWRGGSRVNFFFGGFGYPFGYPYGFGYYPYGYGYYPYGYYPYGYPTGAYYSYDPRGVYEGRMINRPQSTNDGGGKDYSMAARVQRQLADAGYYHGAIDGIIGDGTRRAIRNYERANRLPVDGEIDHQLLDTMGLG